MASNNLWTIIRTIQCNGKITPRDVSRLLNYDSKKAYRLLEHLVSVGAVRNVGRPRHPVFIMEAGGETRIKPLREKQHQPNVAEICRQNWQGYQIHKIFGSTSI